MNDLEYENDELAEIAEAQQKFKKEYKFRSLRHTLGTEAIFFAICLIAFLIVTHFVNISTIHGDGMTPTFNMGDHVLVNKLAYAKKEPVRGDVVAIHGRLLRIVGLPGDEIYMNGGRLYINDMLAEETYLGEDVYTYPVGSVMNFTLQDGEYFVLCDNRYCTEDSRDGTMIHVSDIDGKIVGKI